MAKTLRTARRTSWKFSRALVLLFIVAIMSLGVLSMLRSDSQAMDERVSAQHELLTAYEKECRELEREIAAMMSPQAVHAYALSRLGMAQVHLAGAIRVDVPGGRGGTATASLSRGGREY